MESQVLLIIHTPCVVFSQVLVGAVVEEFPPQTATSVSLSICVLQRNDSFSFANIIFEY